MLVATGKSRVTYLVVVVEVCGNRCRALPDTGAGSSHVSAAFLDRIGKQPVWKEFRRIEILFKTTDKEIEIHDVVIENLSRNFHLRTEIKVNVVCC